MKFIFSRGDVFSAINCVIRKRGITMRPDKVYRAALGILGVSGFDWKREAEISRNEVIDAILEGFVLCTP